MHSPLIHRLSPREQQICRLVSEGQSNEEIAQALSTSAACVKASTFRINNKLGTSTKVELAIFFVREMHRLRQEGHDTPTELHSEYLCDS